MSANAAAAQSQRAQGARSEPGVAIAHNPDVVCTRTKVRAILEFQDPVVSAAVFVAGNVGFWLVTAGKYTLPQVLCTLLLLRVVVTILLKAYAVFTNAPAAPAPAASPSQGGARGGAAASSSDADANAQAAPAAVASADEFAKSAGDHFAVLARKMYTWYECVASTSANWQCLFTAAAVAFVLRFVFGLFSLTTLLYVAFVLSFAMPTLQQRFPDASEHVVRMVRSWLQLASHKASMLLAKVPQLRRFVHPRSE